MLLKVSSMGHCLQLSVSCVSAFSMCSTSSIWPLCMIPLPTWPSAWAPSWWWPSFYWAVTCTQRSWSSWPSVWSCATCSASCTSGTSASTPCLWSTSSWWVQPAVTTQCSCLKYFWGISLCWRVPCQPGHNEGNVLSTHINALYKAHLVVGNGGSYCVPLESAL